MEGVWSTRDTEKKGSENEMAVTVCECIFLVLTTPALVENEPLPRRKKQRVPTVPNKYFAVEPLMLIRFPSFPRKRNFPGVAFPSSFSRTGEWLPQGAMSCQTITTRTRRRDLSAKTSKT